MLKLKSTLKSAKSSTEF